MKQKIICIAMVSMMLAIPISVMGQELKKNDVDEETSAEDIKITYDGLLRVKVNIDANLDSNNYFSVVYIQFNDGYRIRLEGGIKRCNSRMIYTYRTVDGVLNSWSGSIKVEVEIHKSLGGGYSNIIYTDHETGSFWGPFVFL